MGAIAEPEAHVDGRHARRERNRDAVVASLLELYRDGNLEPTADEIAQRSGVSARSLFRYFDDIDDLCRCAVERQLDAVRPILDRRIDPTLPRSRRARAVVEQRIDLFETVGHVGVIARVRAPFQPIIAAQLAGIRHLLRNGLATAFAGELEQLGPEAAGRALAVADVVCTFESNEHLRTDHGFTRDETVGLMADAIERLVTP